MLVFKICNWYIFVNFEFSHLFRIFTQPQQPSCYKYCPGYSFIQLKHTRLIAWDSIVSGRRTRKTGLRVREWLRFPVIKMEKVVVKRLLTDVAAGWAPDNTAVPQFGAPVRLLFLCTCNLRRRLIHNNSPVGVLETYCLVSSRRWVAYLGWWIN